MELPPQSAPFASQAATTAGDADILTGESSDENIDGWEVVDSDFSDIGEDERPTNIPASIPASLLLYGFVRIGCATESLLQDPTTGFVEFDVPGDVEPCSLESEFESSDPGEERSDAHTKHLRIHA